MSRLEIYGLKLPLIEGECDLGQIIVEAAKKQGIGIENGDIVVVTCKIVSKCLGSLIEIDKIEPSKKALKISSKTGEDPKFIELVLRESDEILLVVPVKKLVERGLIDLYSFSRSKEAVDKLISAYPVLFLVLRDGSIWSDAGIDSSNHPPGIYSIPPRNIDSIAKEIRDKIKELTGKNVAVVVCDTEVFFTGSLDIARGSYGIEPVDKGFGEPDLYGKPKYGGVDAIVHEVCAASALIMKQTRQGVPVAIIRGLSYEYCECGYSERVKRDPRRWLIIAKLSFRETIRVLGMKNTLLRFLRIILARL